MTALFVDSMLSDYLLVVVQEVPILRSAESTMSSK